MGGIRGSEGAQSPLFGTVRFLQPWIFPSLAPSLQLWPSLGTLLGLFVIYSLLSLLVGIYSLYYLVFILFIIYCCGF